MLCLPVVWLGDVSTFAVQLLALVVDSEPFSLCLVSLSVAVAIDIGIDFAHTDAMCSSIVVVVLFVCVWIWVAVLLVLLNEALRNCFVVYFIHRVRLMSLLCKSARSCCSSKHSE